MGVSNPERDTGGKNSQERRRKRGDASRRLKLLQKAVIAIHKECSAKEQEIPRKKGKRNWKERIDETITGQ